MPAIMRWPGVIPAGQVIGQVGITMDFTATMLKVADATLPDGYQPEGIDLLPIVSGKAPEATRTLFWRANNANAVRSGDLKLVSQGGLPLSTTFAKIRANATTSPMQANPMRAGCTGCWRTGRRMSMPRRPRAPARRRLLRADRLRAYVNARSAVSCPSGASGTGPDKVARISFRAVCGSQGDLPLRTSIQGWREGKRAPNDCRCGMRK